MNNKMPSTSYVPLQKPYQIIKYKNKIGVQVGTQVLTLSDGTPTGLETHYYPVVAVDNRPTVIDGRHAKFDPDSCDVEVWSDVKSPNRVAVLCEHGTQLSWQQFIEIVWNDHARLSDRREQLQKVHIFNKLIKFNGSMELASPGLHTVHLLTEPSDGTPLVVRSSADDAFALNVPWTEDPDALERLLVADLMDYLLILSPGRSARFWRLLYETNEEQLRPLVKKLNANPKATTFKNHLMATFSVKAILPYEDDERQAPAPQASTPDGKKPHGEKYYGRDVSVFHDNIDSEKVAAAILNLDRRADAGNGTKKKLGNRQFARALYETFNSIHWLKFSASKRDFVDWLKFKCQVYFEDRDCGGGSVSPAIKEKIEEYTGVFTIRQDNGGITDRRDLFFKKDRVGNPLLGINNGK